MSRGKFLSLEEARKLGKLDQFAKEHPSTGDEDRWDELFEAMAGAPTKTSPKRSGSSANKK